MKATEDEEEVNMRHDIHLESSIDAMVREEKWMEEEDVQKGGASKSGVQVHESLEDASPVDEANLQCLEGIVETEAQERESETTREVMSATEAPDFSTEFEDADKKTTSKEVTPSFEPEKQCEETAEANESMEEKASSEEVWYKFGKLLLKNVNFHLFSLKLVLLHEYHETGS